MNAEAVSTLLNQEAASAGIHSVPVEHLDYSYIDKCADPKYMEKILQVLRSGKEGVYPHLTEFCEKRLEKLDPRSRALRKENSPATAASFSKDVWEQISNDLQTWQKEIKVNEQELNKLPLFCDSENLPPVRGSNCFVQNGGDSGIKNLIKKSPLPRSYEDWDKFNVEKECAEIGENPLKNYSPVKINSHLAKIERKIDTTGLTVQEKIVLANREKDKGNEAFRAGDYEEAVAYYSRSVCMVPMAVTFNNRAQAHIKLQLWYEALSDCDSVLQQEPLNAKARLRRATVHKQLGNLDMAHDDITAVLQSEPNNMTAQNLLKEFMKTTKMDKMSHKAKKVFIEELEDVEHGDEDEKEMPGGRMENEENQFLLSKQFTDAEEEYSQSSTNADRRPETSLCSLKLEGDELLKKGQYLNAVEKFSQCLTLSPHDCAAYTNRALCFIKLERFDEARQDCNSALKLQPYNKKALYRRALASKGLKDYVACSLDLQEVLCLDVSDYEAERELVEVTALLKEKQKMESPTQSCTSIAITKVEEKEEEGEAGVSANEDQDRKVLSIDLQPSNAYEFGQMLNVARSQGDTTACAQFLCCVPPQSLPQYMTTYLDSHTFSFIIRVLNTHLLPTEPGLVFQILSHLHTTKRFSVVLMLLDSEEKRQVTQLFETLCSVESDDFSQNDVKYLACKYI